MTLFLIPLLAWLVLVAGLLLAWRASLLALWREPVFKAPILIVESDDWGAGPLQQAEALTRIREVLLGHRDETGRPAVMTLALVLAIPSPRSGDQPYRRRTLEDAEFAPVLSSIREGAEQGVFALQLHGMEHGWPAAWIKAAADHPAVAEWLARPGASEALPSHLQSRWTDATTLPSRPHAPEEIQAAVAEETGTFRKLFCPGESRNVGAPSGANFEPAPSSATFAPEGAPTDACSSLVVVPPTFVWDARVEAAWAAHGVEVVITPGRRLTCRDVNSKPACQDKVMLNGERGEGDVLYLVRDDYFEPSFGHRPEQALAALVRKTALGRPCLLETHRGNFLPETGGDPTTALAALDDLYTRAKHHFPDLRFAACAELGHAIKTVDANWIEQDPGRRFTIWLRRAADLPRFGKAARLLGLLPLLNLLARF